MLNTDQQARQAVHLSYRTGTWCGSVLGRYSVTDRPSGVTCKECRRRMPK